MRYDRDHKARTRERILREAAAAIRANGAHGVGVADIMARAGLTQGAFYAHFESKDDLVAQAIGEMFESRYAAFLQSVEAADPAAGLSGFIDGYLSMRHRNAFEQGCPLPLLGAEISRLSAAAQAAFDEGLARLNNAVSVLLKEIGVKNANAAASSAMAEMVGAITLARTIRDDKQAESVLRSSRKILKERLGLV
jgi:TetR/AcrR family transcriptional repressor of nem operon